ncbi:unannotated protein [freshwater metagenome]|uniref:Unannotated protein n=1 Tax=freshwater metagenome TaxID=449393 RepID=A0A6J5YGS6_9ZZZZ
MIGLNPGVNDGHGGAVTLEAVGVTGCRSVTELGVLTGYRHGIIGTHSSNQR